MCLGHNNTTPAPRFRIPTLYRQFVQAKRLDSESDRVELASNSNRSEAIKLPRESNNRLCNCFGCRRVTQIIHVLNSNSLKRELPGISKSVRNLRCEVRLLTNREQDSKNLQKNRIQTQGNKKESSHYCCLKLYSILFVL